MKVGDGLAAELRSSLSVSFTVDGWSSMGQHFLGITAHFLSHDGELKAAQLPLQHVPAATPHSGAEYARLFGDTLATALDENPQVFLSALSAAGTEGNILRKIGAVTSDGAANMIKFGEHLLIPRVPCVAHRLHLFVMVWFSYFVICHKMNLETHVGHLGCREGNVLQGVGHSRSSDEGTHAQIQA